ncbi:MAG: ABC transporter permease, partial [Lachnospiraceae bacterium]|nr:ABC transporter permease [Lachnospiraceae bacterium]
MSKKTKWLAMPYTIWGIGFIIIPLIIVLFYGFTDVSGHFTIEGIASIFTHVNLKALIVSMLLSFASTLVCLVMAYPLAYILAEVGRGKSSLLSLIFILPMWMNSLLRTIAWQNLLEKTGLINAFLSFCHLPTMMIINTPWAIVLGMVYDFLPFMILPIYNVLCKIDKDTIN